MLSWSSKSYSYIGRSEKEGITENTQSRQLDAVGAADEQHPGQGKPYLNLHFFVLLLRQRLVGFFGRATKNIFDGYPLFCFLFRAVIENTVDHSHVIFHSHFSVFQIIPSLKIFDLLKAEAVAVMIGYFRPTLYGNDVADGQAVAEEVGGTPNVELLENFFQNFVFGAAVVQRLRVDRIVINYGRLVFQLIE